MADLRAERIVGDDDPGALDVVVDEAGFQSSAMVDVVEAVSEVRRDLHPRQPRGQNGEARVSRVSQALSEIHAVDELVREVDVIPGERRADQLDQARVVAPADRGESAGNLRRVNLATELSLEDDGVRAAERASPRR